MFNGRLHIHISMGANNTKTMGATSYTREALIAVIGVTGAGKTTFISRATGRGDLKIGHDIDSCEFDARNPGTSNHPRSLTRSGPVQAHKR